MSPRSRLAWVLGLAIVAVATAPLSLLVDRLPLAAQGVTAREASGSVWHGVMRSAAWHGQSLGDVSTGLQALPLLLGERRLQLGNASWQGTLVEGNRHGLVNGTGTITLPLGATLAGATARISMQDAVLLFEDQQCSEASGRLQAALQVALPAVPEVRLAGDLTCVQGQGRVVMASAADAVLHLDAVLDIDAGGGYTLQSTAQALDPGSRLALQLAGFQETPAGLVRNDSGRLAP